MRKHTGIARTAVLGIAATAVAVSLSGGAVAAPSATSATVVPPNSVNKAAIQTGAVDTWKIQDKTIGGWDVLDNTLPLSKMGYDFRQAIAAADVSKADAIKSSTQVKAGALDESDLNAAAQAKLNDARQQVYADAITTPVVITNIGGPIATNGTKLSAVDLVLPAGTYLVQVSGQIDRTTAATTPGKATQPQLSLWFDNNNDDVFQWQTGEGSISPNGTIPDTKDRSVTVNGQTMVTLDQSTHVKLLAFGYNADTSAAGGGELTVGAAMVSATPIK